MIWLGGAAEGEDIVQYDFGDAPDGPYPTLLASNGARHVLGASNLRLGYLVDSEPDGLETFDVDGDDTTTSQDEDGVTLEGFLTPGQSATIKVVTSLGSGYLSGWIDADQNGSWSSFEQFLAGVAVSPGTHTYNVPLPAEVPNGWTVVRFRLSSDRASIMQPTGAAPDGEVEDYAVEVGGTLLADAGGPYTIAVGDSLTLDASKSYGLKPITSYAWDFDSDGTVDLETTVPQVTVSWDDILDAGGYPGTYYPLLTVTDNVGVSAEDETVITIFEVDMGDAPDPTYPTLLASNGARHVLNSGLYLGQYVDGEEDGQPSEFASGDDENGFFSDEDGLRMEGVPSPGGTIKLFVTASNNGILDAWIDLDQNGSWDADEKFLAGQAVVGGENEFSLTIPGDALLGPTYVRFRLTSTGVTLPTGRASDGEVEDYWIEILPPNQAPIADTNGPYVISVGEGVVLDGSQSLDPDQANGDTIVSYEWDLDGDGEFDDAIGPTVALDWDQLVGFSPEYPANPVTGQPNNSIGLRVTDSFGGVGTASTTITIYDNRPTARFTASPNPAARAQLIDFDASGSSHGHPDHAILTYSWDFGDGNEATGQFVSHAYTVFGTYTVTLIVIDDNVPPEASFVSLDVDVNQGSLPPTANPGGPYTINLGESLSLDGSWSSDPDMIYGDSLVSYEWDLDGDGSFDDASGVDPIVTWAELLALGVEYPADPVTGEPNNPISLRVTDEFGLEDTASTTLKIYDNIPVALFSAVPNPALPGEIVTFDASASYQVNPERTLVSYEWDFGNDGSIEATGEVTSHSFPVFGTYEVELTVTDDNVPPKTDTATITVVVNTPPIADAGVSYVTTLGSPVTFNGSGSLDEDAAAGDSIVEYAWDLDGDGEFDDASGENPTLTWEQIHALGLTYSANPGAEPPNGIALRVRDTLGASHIATAGWEIVDRPPVAAAGGPYQIAMGSALVLDGSGSSDPDSDCCGDSIVEYGWDLNDDGTVDVTSADAQVTVSWTTLLGLGLAPGAASSLKLTVVDEYGVTDTDTASLTILPVDLGDAPDPSYPTLLASDGARHILNGFELPELYLGALVDGELDGSSSTNADGDDANGSDEDGVILVGDLIRGRSTLVRVTASAAGILDAWIDLDQNGTWDADERFADNLPLAAGTNDLEYLVPPDAVAGNTYARFRLSSTGGLSPTGLASDGEVEDYRVLLKAPPVVVTGGPYVVVEGSSISLDGSGSTDPDGSIVDFAWDLDNDGSYDDASGPTYLFSAADIDGEQTFTIGLQVTDSDGIVSVSATSLTVANGSPIIHAVSSSGPVDETSSVTVSIDATDPAGDADSLTYEFDFDNDGTYEISGTDATAHHTYGDNGSYTVLVRVLDDDGGVTPSSIVITVNNVAPVIDSFTASSPSDEGSPVTLTVVASDIAGDADPLTYEFDLNDDGVFDINQSSHTLVHTFPDNGDYKVNVRVSDGDGGTVTESMTVAVQNAPPVISAVDSDSPIGEGSPVTISVTATDPAGASDPLTYAFDFNDDGVYEVSGSSSSAQHVYPQAGTYGVAIRVTDGDGGEDISSTTVSVKNVPPSVDAGQDRVSRIGVAFIQSGSFSDPGDDSWTAMVDYGDGGGIEPLHLNPDHSFQLNHIYTSLGTFDAVVTVNDGDVSSTDTVKVTVVPPTLILDNGDAGFSTVGNWLYADNQGHAGDVHYAARGSGTFIASWVFNNLTPGIYRVSATWSPYHNRATNAPFTIRDGGTRLATVQVNQELAPNDFDDAGSSWEDLGGPYVVNGSSLRVELGNNANEWVIADAIRVEQLLVPEIQLKDGSQDLVDNSATVTFGSATLGGSSTKTFTVKNLGSVPLTLGALSVPVGFTLTSGLGSTTLAANNGAAGGPDETTFTVALDTSVIGLKSGQISLSNNDSDENPFNFSVNGTVIGPSPAVQIIDDGDAGFATSGSWLLANNQGNATDVHFAPLGSGNAKSTWTFAGLTPGLYRVAATWSPYYNRATNSPFTIKDGAAPLNTVRVNQEPAPNDFTDSGASWENLGGPYAITGDTLVVELTNAANEWVIADAVRIERVVGAEIQVNDGSAEILDDTGSSSFGSVEVGAASQKTFTVKNLGTEPLLLGNPSIPAGFSLVSGLGLNTLLPNDGLAGGPDETSFTVGMNTATPGVKSGTIALVTNDPDENPFSFSVGGTVLSAGSTVQIIDNGQAGFSTVGSWLYANNQGYQTDVHYAEKGTGSAIATWEFTGLTAGVYRIAATWSPYFNRATNAPFTIKDGSTVLNTVAINQEPAPNDFTESGIAWEQLGGPYTVTGSSLTVTLTNAANEWVIADAIRIDRLAELSVPRIGEQQAASLMVRDVQPLLAAAIREWDLVAPGAATLLAGTRVQIGALPAGRLGLASAATGDIWLSPDAAGHGWFVDPSPEDDDEFLAGITGPANRRMDLLTVLAHELGHVLRRAAQDANSSDVMLESLNPGQRRLPGHDAAFAEWEG